MSFAVAALALIADPGGVRREYAAGWLVTRGKTIIAGRGSFQATAGGLFGLLLHYRHRF